MAHGGGPACFGMGRLDRGWQVRREARVNISRPPSYYQSRLYYDIVVMSERSLRFLIDQVGIERVVLGQRLPLRPLGPVPHRLAPKPGKPDPGREGHDSVEEPGKALLGIETRGVGCFLPRPGKYTRQPKVLH